MQALAELDRAKTVFFSNVSHELRTPLTLMLSPIDELLAAGPAGADPAEAHAQLQLAQRNGQRLLRLVNTLLDFSRIEAGRLQARFEPLDLAALTIDLASVFRSAMERSGLGFVIDCPPLAEPVFVDRSLWEKIVLNLLSNAFKFTFEGEVRVTLRADAESAYLSVSDTGTGIPDAALPHLFERFYRVDGAQGRSIEGSGIGLALVHDLVRLHGGEVAAHSRAGQGSRFAVSVPLGHAHLPPELVAAAALPRESALDADVYIDGEPQEIRDTAWGSLDAASGTVRTATAASAAASLLEATDADDAPGVETAAADTRPLVVVADDNADMRGYLRRLLSAHHRVIVAPDGAAALALARTERPELVLSDVMMPRLSGFELLRALRADARTEDVPVILLSARAGEEARIEGLAAGADDYLLKPFNARELLARVSGTLALARARRERAEREVALRAETENVLESVTEGFVACDADWVVTYANSAAERLVSIRRKDMFGRTIWELFPGLAGHSFEATYRRAMRERVSMRVDDRYEPLGVWFEVNVYPVTGGGLAFYFRDVLASRLLQEALRASDERNRLLVALDDATRALDDADEVVAVNSRLIGEHFGADRCVFALVEADGEHVRIEGAYCREGVARIDGRLRLHDFGVAVIAPQQAGQALLVSDAAEDSRVGDSLAGWQAAGIAAAVSVPLLRNGAMVATLALHQGVPRAWSGDEVELLRLVVNRCWEAVERAHAVRALRESEHEFRVLADAMPQIVYVTEADGRTSFVNRQWSEYTGCSDAQAADMAAAVHPDDMPGLEQSWQQAVQAGATRTAEFRLRRARTGWYRWFLTRALPSRDATGRIVRWYGTSTDIDAHKQTEQALRASEQRFRRVADPLPHSVFSFDATGTAVWVNRHAAVFAGNAELLLAARRYELIHPDDRDRVRAAWRQSLATGEPYEAEVRMRRHDGVWRWTLSRAVALRNEATGDITEWIAGSVDIDELRNAQQALQAADRRKDEFLATL
ncbi:MAG: PAS domain-containing protein, partial [Methylibium sp.]|nr:PAS domain-containing protein [Methylibium sp.]